MRKFLLSLLFTMLAVPAFGLEPRTIDFTQPLTALDGSAMKISATDASTFTLGEAAVNALLATLDEDRQLAGTEKVKRYELARKVFHQKNVVLTVEELALIKERIGKTYGPLVVGAAWRILDPPAGLKPASE